MDGINILNTYNYVTLIGIVFAIGIFSCVVGTVLFLTSLSNYADNLKSTPAKDNFKTFTIIFLLTILLFVICIWITSTLPVNSIYEVTISPEVSP